MNLNLPLIASVLSALGGAVGVVVTPLYGSNLTGAVQALLVAVSGLLVALPVHHAASTAAAQAKAKIATPPAVHV